MGFRCCWEGARQGEEGDEMDEREPHLDVALRRCSCYVVLVTTFSAQLRGLLFDAQQGSRITRTRLKKYKYTEFK